MNAPSGAPGESASAPGRQWLGLAGAIASASIVGIILSGVSPLLSLNLEREGVNSAGIGLMGATPSLAVVSVSALIPLIIRRIGAAPSIYAGSGLALAMLLLFPIVTAVPVWFGLRFVMGLGLGLALVVSETWINALAPPEKRGSVMGIYVAFFSAGLATGPILISVTGSQGALPFVAIAVVMAVAILPIPLASRSGAPALRDHPTMTLRQAFRHAPVVMVASLVNGVIWLTTMALLPVYGVRSGLAEDQALFLLTAYVIGNIGFQFPIGRLLDRWNADLILVGCGIVQVLGALVLPLVVDKGALAWLMLLIWGGFLGGSFTTSMTMLGRAFKTEQLSGANSAFSLALEVGGLVGPLFAGLAMWIWDPHGMLVVIGATGAGLAWIALGSHAAQRRR